MRGPADPQRIVWGIITAHWGRDCVIAAANGSSAPAEERHHARIHDKKWVRARYPLFVDSVFNILPVSHRWHMRYGGFGKWPERKVAWYEARMRKNPQLAAWANGKSLDWARRVIAKSALSAMDGARSGP